MPKTFKQLAIIGSTASGKTSLAIKVAHQMNAYILSLDSLSIYKDIDIVSAKPSLEEREGILHFGLDYIYPHENFDVTIFIKLYHETYDRCVREGKNLIIVGGTGFYLKMLINGISKLPSISDKTKEEVHVHLMNLQQAHAFLYALDENYMGAIETTDAYRIEKALNIYSETKLTPSQYFKAHPPKPTITDPLPIYQIVWERSALRERIAKRTTMMVNAGLIDEICMLEAKYTRKPNAMKAIGVKETLAYLDGIYTKEMLLEKITTNTSRLAKRQTTFNNSQFTNVTKGNVKELENLLLLKGK
ncbi:MAG: tRNA (adenosine(37)-N6)-dimethylallyltransferase MiaA [Sulfurovum sp.]|nr:tRNA (adenosine(37)-N6)-dimethylallyltransferase MiaA [Sulfurovum sp.]